MISIHPDLQPLDSEKHFLVPMDALLPHGQESFVNWDLEFDGSFSHMVKQAACPYPTSFGLILSFFLAG